MKVKAKNNLLIALSLIFAAVCFFNSLVFSKKVHAETLAKNEITVFSWEDYIDVDLLDEFEEETGISVNYITFATCEEMYNEVVKNPKACDLLCPSEYMIMKMRDEGLIKEYTVPQTYKENVSPYIAQVFDDLGLNTKNGKTYASGYLWGTMGMIYNMDKGITAQDLNRWSALLNDSYKGKITIKDSVRDTYIVALCMVYEQELLSARTLGDIEYKEKLNEILNRTDSDTINKVQDVLVGVKNNLYGFEVDSGKSDILTGKIDINFAWSGDAVYSIGEGIDAGVNLGYVVPEEASNVWFDGWVMPKEANEDYATQFINFVSRPENAVRNIDYVGYTSCIAGDVVFENAVDWYGAENLPEILSLEDMNKEIENDSSLNGCFVPYNGGYALKGSYGRIIKDGERTFLRTFDLDDSGNEVNFGEEELYKVDLKYFFDPDCTDDTYVIYSLETGRQLYAQYSDEETIKRCVVMQNFDKETLEKVNEMWSTVKLITLPTWAIITLTSFIALALIAIVLFKFKDKLFVKKIPDGERKEPKNGLKVIKKEQL